MSHALAPALLFASLALACGASGGTEEVGDAGTAEAEAGSASRAQDADDGRGYAELLADGDLEQATFAGGCFWCVESAFEEVPGVVEAVSGYAGGEEPEPTYEEVSAGRTDHVEAVRVFYEPDRVSYSELLSVFWRNIDPTDAGGQFADRGSQYETAVFVADEEERRQAEASLAELERAGPFDQPLVTPIRPLEGFYPAEAYHQDYHRKHPERYGRYYEGSGRGPFLRRVWAQTEK